MRTATLLATRRLSPSVRELTFEAGVDHAFAPGQWVTLFVPQEGAEPLRRSYSIASPPRTDGTFDLAVTLVEGGPASTYLHGIEPGTQLRMVEAAGVFTLDPVVRPVLMVATGTGIAPFRSMLLDLARRADPDLPEIVLLSGHRTEDELLYRAELTELSLPRYRFEPTLSRADGTWSGRRGWVQTHVPELVASLGGDCDVYVCGLNRMVAEVRTLLRQRIGLERKRVHVERYD